MATLQELREQRANIWAQAQEFNERHKRGDEMSAEDEGAWQRALSEVDALGEKITTREKSDELESRFAQIDAQRAETVHERTGEKNADEQYRAAFEQFVRRGLSSLDQEQRSLVESQFDPQVRAQSLTAAAGGYTVPEGFWAKVTETLKLYGGAEAGAEIITTASGNALPWPTNDDTANVGELLAENVAAAEQDFTFGVAQLDSFMFSSKMVKVSLQLLQDTGIDIEGYLARKMGERLGRIENTYLTTGTGTGQPHGYVTGATTGKTTAGSAAITINEIIDLIHSVDAAYRASGRCQFKLHDLVLAYVRKIRDDSGGAGVGRPIWEPSVQAGTPDLILGHPYTINNDMASSLVTTAKSMAFGDFNAAFVVRRVSGGQMMRLSERYAESLQVAFLGFERLDSAVQNSGAVKLMVQV